MRKATYNLRLERRFDFSLLQVLPLDVPEEGVVLDGLLPAVCLHSVQINHSNHIQF